MIPLSKGHSDKYYTWQRLLQQNETFSAQLTSGVHCRLAQATTSANREVREGKICNAKLLLAQHKA